MDYPRDAIALERRLYLAEPPSIVEVIAEQAPAIESLLVVGHNPGLTQVVHDLLPSFDVEDLPTGAVVALEYAAADDWADVATRRQPPHLLRFPQELARAGYDPLSGPRCRARSSKRRVRLSGLPGVGGV